MSITQEIMQMIDSINTLVKKNITYRYYQGNVDRGITFKVFRYVDNEQSRQIFHTNTINETLIMINAFYSGLVEGMSFLKTRNE